MYLFRKFPKVISKCEYCYTNSNKYNYNQFRKYCSLLYNKTKLNADNSIKFVYI